MYNYAKKVLISLIIFSIFISEFVPFVYAATSPWTASDNFSLTNSEKLTNTGFETDLTGWSGTPSTFADTSFINSSSAVAAWPLDDTTTTQSYSRVLNPAVATGRNMIINGTFDADANWTKGTGWTISGGAAHAVSAANSINLSQSIPMINGKAYQTTFTVSNYVAGTIRVNLNGTSQGSARTANGTYTEIVIANNGASNFYLQPTSTFTGDIDDVSVTQVNIPASSAATTNLLSDGNMETSGTSAWTAVVAGTITKDTTSPHGGTQNLRIARSTNNNPIYKQTIMTTGTVYRVSGYMRSDGSATPRIYSSTGSTLLSGTTSTSWLPFDTIFVADGPQFQIGAVTSTGTQYVEFDDIVVSIDQTVRTGELSQDGDMEASGTTSWIGNGPVTLSKQTTSPHGGTQNLRVAYSSSTNPNAYQTILVIGKKYRVTGWYRGDGGTTTPRVTMLSNTQISLGTSSNAWQQFDATFIADSASFALMAVTSSSGYAEFDDLSVTEVDPLVGLPTNGVILGSSTGTSGHLTTGYTFDGTNDNVNIYSSDLNSVFNPSEGTAIVWAKVNSSGVWTDATNRKLFQLGADGNNFLFLFKTSTTNQLSFQYDAGGTTKTVSDTSLAGTTNWFQFALSWSKSNDQVKMYLNGSQVGSTQTGLGTWVGNLSSTLAGIGAQGSSGSSPWSGMINDVRLYNTALSSSQISTLYSGIAATRDTSIFHGGVASAKLVAADGYTSSFTQNVNVGNTNNYNLLAYAYIDGTTPVTSSYASLYYNGSPVTTTYTSVGGGWYSLTGTVTGVASSVSAGVQVVGSQTVYVDDFSLNGYPSSDTLTSSIFDSGQGSNWGTLTYSVITPAGTTATLKVRSGNDASLSDAAAFSSCTAIPSGTIVGGTSCVTNATRYAQYQITLTSGGTNTPTFQSLSIPFSSSDTDPPTGLTLDSPGSDTYTNSLRPTFRWKTATDVGSGMSKYLLTVTNSDGTGFTIDNIPPASSLTTDRYVITYDTNGYISIYTKSSNLWTSSQNDGKLKDGKIDWRVTAYDNLGNSVSTGRQFYVDTVAPVLSNVALTGSSKPTITGKLTDNTSGPDSVNIKLEKRNFLGNYDLYLSANVNVANNEFSFTPDNNLPDGNYKITVVGKDKAGNLSNSVILNLNIPGGNITYIQQLLPSASPTPVVPGNPPLNVTPSPTLTPSISSFNFDIFKLIASIWNRYSNFVVSTNSVITGSLASAVTGAASKVSASIAFIFNKGSEAIAFADNALAGFNSLSLRIANSFSGGIRNISIAWGQRLDSLIANATGAWRNILAGVRSTYLALVKGIGISHYIAEAAIRVDREKVIAGITKPATNISLAMSNMFNAIEKSREAIALNIGKSVHNTAKTLATAWNNSATGARKNLLSFGNRLNDICYSIKINISELAFNTGQRTKNISERLGQSIISLGYLLQGDPTTIQNVKVATLSPTSVKITWQTNQPATGKVNYGLDETYPLDVQSTKLVKDHEFILTGLEPNTKYSFEVMSQGKNYVYDANRKFVTPKAK